MADPTYALGVQPNWYLVDNVGRPTAGFMYTYSNLNPTDYKPVYSDASNNFPYPNPVPFAENGTAGPIYFEFDSDTPDELYYLRFYDEDMNFLYDINNYNGGAGGGSGNITTAINLKNYAGNNVFQWNTGDSASPVADNTILAPSNHNNFIDPDIRFFNDVVDGTDQITFPEFTLGLNPLVTDVTPQYYLEYSCTVAGSDTVKYIQFPIQPKVNTLNDQNITVTFWAQFTGGAGDTVTIQTRQFFGTANGSVTPSADVFHVIGAPVTVDATWTKYSVSGTIPGVSTKTLSSNGDDALYLIVSLPNATTSTIDITKVSMYLGDTAPLSDFNSMQQIEALIESPRTGDTKPGMSYSSYVPGGWCRLNDGTVGPETASVGGPTIIRANVDTWFLYSYIWNSTSNADCPIYTSAGVASTRGATASDDWEANKRIALPNGSGRVVANINGSHVIGSSAGVDSANVTLNETPDHKHDAPAGSPMLVTSPSSGIYVGGGGLGTGLSSPATGTVTGHGGQTALSRIQPTVYMPTIIKL